MRARKAFVIRLGAIGDIVLITPVLAALKRDGYAVTLLAKPHAKWLLKGTGLVDEWVIADHAFEDEVVRRTGGDEGYHVDRAFDYSRELAAQSGAEKIVDLAGIIEGKAMVKVWEFSPEFAKQAVGIERRAGHGVLQDFKPSAQNHVDMLLEAAGYDPAGIADEHKIPAWRVLPDEARWAQKKFKRWNITARNFTIVYQLSGSGIAKTWPFYKQLCGALGKSIAGVRVILLGYGDEEVLAYGWPEMMPWVIPYAADRCPRKAVRDDKGRVLDYVYDRNPNSLREDGALIKAADCYIGPDTSFLHVAAAVGTPTVPLLTVTSHENISKYYPQSHPVESPAKCSPCGLLVTSCFTGTTGAAVCMEEITPKLVLNKVAEVYREWLASRQSSRRSA